MLDCTRIILCNPHLTFRSRRDPHARSYSYALQWARSSSSSSSNKWRVNGRWCVPLLALYRKEEEEEEAEEGEE